MTGRIKPRTLKFAAPNTAPKFFEVRFWTTEDAGIRECVWRYYANEQCHRVVPDLRKGQGVPYVDEWYTGAGRIQGWQAGLNILERTHDVHATRPNAVARRLEQIKDQIIRLRRRLTDYETELYDLRSETFE